MLAPVPTGLSAVPLPQLGIGESTPTRARTSRDTRRKRQGSGARDRQVAARQIVRVAAGGEVKIRAEKYAGCGRKETLMKPLALTRTMAEDLRGHDAVLIAAVPAADDPDAAVTVRFHALPFFDDPGHWGTVLHAFADYIAGVYAKRRGMDPVRVKHRIHQAFVDAQFRQETGWRGTPADPPEWS